MEPLLLDTSYLLPIFGLKVDLKDFDAAFPKLLGSYSVIYNPVSLVEAKWILLKIANRNPSQRGVLLGRYREGVGVLQGDERLRQSPLTDQVVEEVADELLIGENVKDYFDRVIYATAARLDIALLTEDEKLLELAKHRRARRPKQVIQWKDLLGKV